MPKQVIKYTCEFKCRHKAVGDQRKIIAHEKMCLKNPANKTCNTCTNQLYSSDSDEFSGRYHIRGCKLQVMEQFISDIYDHLVLTETATHHVKPLVHCPNWNQDKETVYTASYLNEIRPKIEQAARKRRQAKEEHEKFVNAQF